MYKVKHLKEHKLNKRGKKQIFANIKLHQCMKTVLTTCLMPLLKTILNYNVKSAEIYSRNTIFTLNPETLKLKGQKVL